jgi:protocatechuate 3,4-dioxygenase beta subunit
MNEIDINNRRHFLKQIAAMAPAVPLVLAGCMRSETASAQSKRPTYPSTLGGGAPCGSCIAPADICPRAFITEPNEPGDLTAISGTMYLADGKTPAAGYVLFIYQTDATGYYNKNDDPGHPRLRGWMKAGADGRYEFLTIKPAPYPHRRTPAHIHVHVYGPGFSERSIGDYWFEGDAFLTQEVIDKAAADGARPYVVSLKRDLHGILRGTRDIIIDHPK